MEATQTFFHVLLQHKIWFGFDMGKITHKYHTAKSMWMWNTKSCYSIVKLL